MILDAALLSLGKVISNTQYPDSVKRSVALVPQMGLSDINLGDGVTVVNPITRQEVVLTGRVDYTVFRYAEKHDFKGSLHYSYLFWRHLIDQGLR